LIFIDVKKVELFAQFKELLTALEEILGPTPSGKPSTLEYYALICFAIDDLDELVEKFDEDALSFLLKSFGEHLNRFFYPRGGYCLRETINEYSVFFPNKDLDSVEIILEDFASGLKETGMPKTTIRPLADETVSADTVMVNVLAGSALGKPLIEKELVLEFARFNQEILVRFSFDGKTRASGN
jgi:hypothetical protein